MRFLLLVLVPLALALPAAAQPSAKEHQWRMIEADNGAIYRIDLAAVGRFGANGADVLVYLDAGDGADFPGLGYNPNNLTRLYFDCRGHFADAWNPMIWQYAPPRSVAGRIAALVCPK